MLGNAFRISKNGPFFKRLHNYNVSTVEALQIIASLKDKPCIVDHILRTTYCQASLSRNFLHYSHFCQFFFFWKWFVNYSNMTSNSRQTHLTIQYQFIIHLQNRKSVCISTFRRRKKVERG